MTAHNTEGVRWPQERYRTLRGDPDARLLLRARAAVVAALRRWLDGAGFVEIDTPLLQPVGTGRVQPFRVAVRALDQQLALRSSPLYLRGMLAGGFEQVYEVARSFRDEPPDATHLPEYTLVEIFHAHADHAMMRHLAWTLVHEAARAARGCLGQTRQHLSGRWPITDIYDALGRVLDQHISPETTAAQLRDLAAAHAPSLDATSADEIVLALYDRLVEPATSEPTFYTGYPASCAPLAERDPVDERRAQKWDLVIGGREIATAYTELSDPAELRRRFRRLRHRHTEADTIDERMLAVFDLGMPPAAGLCIGLDRLMLTLTRAESVHEIVPVPIAPHPRRRTPSRSAR
ncbi:MAG: amino acid--tRNA ligase-related protein [Pseudonocardia sp.]